MKKIKIAAIVALIFLLFQNLLSEELYFTSKGVYGFLGVTVHVGNVFAEKYSGWREDLDESQKENFDSVDGILNNLCKRFIDAKNAFDQMGSTLPSCLKGKLNEYFGELKNGTKKLDIYWDLKETSSYKRLPDQLHGSGLSPATASEIFIWDAYKERFWEIIENKGSKKVLTGSLFLHELIHSVKKAYNFKCFHYCPNKIIN